MPTSSNKYHLPTQPSMLRRDRMHDYQLSCVYLVTVMKTESCPRLCEVMGFPEAPMVKCSEVGVCVTQAIWQLPNGYPQVQVLAYQVMPDHVHLVLYVKERLPESIYLGNIIASWKATCSKLYWESLNLKDQALQTDKIVQRRPIFVKGFNDSILHSGRNLNAMIAYVHDNPRRLLIKRLNADLFEVKRAIQIAGMEFDTIGNLELLKAKKRVVHCHRRWSVTELERYQTECIEAARASEVLVSPFISNSERAILHQAEESQSAIIKLLENGFPDRYKPIGQNFESCASGKLLMLSPWRYHTQHQRVTRHQCESLNQMAEAIASE